MSRSTVRFCIAAIAVLGIAGTGVADVVSIEPTAFGTNKTVESFEEIASVQLPPLKDPVVPIASEMPVPWDFGSGVSLTGVASGQDERAIVYDFSLTDPNLPYTFAWGFNWGGFVDGSVGIPGGAAVLCHANYFSGLFEPIVFEFDDPVARVGTYTEAAIHEMGGLGSVAIEAFDEYGASLGIVEGTTDGCGWTRWGEYIGDFDSWIGLQTADGLPTVKSIAVYGDSLAMDDLTFEVPEPSTLILLGIGFLALRRR